MIVASFFARWTSNLHLGLRQPAAAFVQAACCQTAASEVRFVTERLSTAGCGLESGSLLPHSKRVSHARLRCSADCFKLLIAFGDGVGDDLLTGGIKSSVAGRHGLFNLLRTASSNDR